MPERTPISALTVAGTRVLGHFELVAETGTWKVRWSIEGQADGSEPPPSEGVADVRLRHGRSASGLVSLVGHRWSARDGCTFVVYSVVSDLRWV